MYNKGISSNWVDDKRLKSVFTLDNNTVTIINLKDENLLSIKNSMKFFQSIYGVFSVTDK